MPAQALVLALAASIYPPAVAAVIAFGGGAEVRSRVFVFVLAGVLVTYAVGALILYALVELGATGARHLSPGAGVEVALGVLLLLLALRLHRHRPVPAPADGAPAVGGAPAASSDQMDGAPAAGGVFAGKDVSPEDAAQAASAQATVTQAAAASGSPSKIERYLQSRRLAFALGILLYVLPSPIYIGAVKAIADAGLSTADELLALLATVVVMLWMIELPMLMLLVVPARATATLERVNLWFVRHGRSLAIVAAVAVGVYLIVTGLVHLLG